MAFKDIDTGQITDYYPPSGRIIGLPDDIAYPERNYRRGPDTAELGAQLGADPRFLKFLKWCFIIGAIGLALFVTVALVEMQWNKLMKYDQSLSRGKPNTYTAGQLRWSGLLYKLQGKATQVAGDDVFVTGDVDGMNLDSYSNLTLKGAVTNSHLTAYRTLTLGDVSNSTLTAHKIVITGKAVNVKQVILRPYEGIPLSKRPH
jgi:hypothetical protein